MKRTIICLGALLLAGVMVSPARAGHGGNTEVADGTDYGTVAGDYHVGHWYTHPFSRGVFPPLAGFHRSHKLGAARAGGPGAQGPSTQLVFPTHNYARSPRDFYMLDP